MKAKTKFKLFLHKSYLDKGLGMTSYVKYLIAFVGIFDLIDANWAIFGAIAYVLFCYLFGWYLYNHGWVDMEQEVSNKYNLFVREMRRKKLK